VPRRIVVLSGRPGSGKTTIASALAAELELPLFAKDSIKETLHDAMGGSDDVDRAWSQRLGAGAMELLWRLAGDAPGCVLEANFAPTMHPRQRVVLAELSSGGSLVEVHCVCPPDEAARRFEARALTSSRHRIHVEKAYSDEWRSVEAVIGLGPVIEVDTTVPVDVRAIAREVRRAWEAEMTDDEAVVRLRRAIQLTAEHVAGRASTGIGHDGADDVHGTIATDDAVGFDPIPLLEAIDEMGIPVVVIGQVAGIMHGSTELTGDLDVLWDAEYSHAYALAGVLTGFGATLVDNDENPVPCEQSSFLMPKVQFTTANASGDFCTTALPWGDLDVTSFLERAESATTADGYTIRYLALDDLIAMRRAVGRAKDLRRADELERLSRPH
jgi:predicted kinase